MHAHTYARAHDADAAGADAAAAAAAAAATVAAATATAAIATIITTSITTSAVPLPPHHHQYNYPPSTTRSVFVFLVYVISIIVCFSRF